jgi:hypothetical protein
MSSQQPPERIDGPREATGRMENEPKIESRNPRERRRNRVSLAHLSGGMVTGAAIFAGILAIIAQLVGQHYGAWTYVIIAIVGSGVGSGIAPLLALARQDGTDNDVVSDRRPGRADAPIEGAEAIDEGRAMRSGGHH